MVLKASYSCGALKYLHFNTRKFHNFSPNRWKVIKLQTQFETVLELFAAYCKLILITTNRHLNFTCIQHHLLHLKVSFPFPNLLQFHLPSIKKKKKKRLQQILRPTPGLSMHLPSFLLLLPLLNWGWSVWVILFDLFICWHVTSPPSLHKRRGKEGRKCYSNLCLIIQTKLSTQEGGLSLHNRYSRLPRMTAAMFLHPQRVTTEQLLKRVAKRMACMFPVAIYMQCLSSKGKSSPFWLMLDLTS